MAKLTQSGYSYRVTITAEDLYPSSNLAGGTIPQDMVMNPPQIKNTRAYSKLIGNTGAYPSWAFRKIVEPRYDGIGFHTGFPVNFPDMISEQHFIGVLRSTEDILAPDNQFIIQETGTSNGT